jgi:hypothetical protein
VRTTCKRTLEGRKDEKLAYCVGWEKVGSGMAIGLLPICLRRGADARLSFVAIARRSIDEPDKRAFRCPMYAAKCKGPLRVMSEDAEGSAEALARVC